MIIQIHGRNPIYNFSWVDLSCTRTSSHHQQRSAPWVSDAPDSGTWFLCCWVRPNKTNLGSLQPSDNKIIKGNLVFQHMFVSSFNNGREIGKLSNKSTSRISDTKSTSRRIACEGCKDVYGKNWTTSKVRLPWPQIAVPVVMLQDYPGPFQEMEWIKGYQINVWSREKNAWEKPA